MISVLIGEIDVEFLCTGAEFLDDKMGNKEAAGLEINGGASQSTYSLDDSG